LRQRILPVFLCLLASLPRAQAVPSFAEQTGQPCAACHVGAFGPQLRPFGRQFKLNGYTASDGADHFPPIAASVYGSFTHTKDDQPQPAARWFSPNDNIALDQASLYYAGSIDKHFGAFAQITYDGIGHQLHIDNTDIRYARGKTIFGAASVVGLTLNNAPTVQDLWNSTPVWGFPYNSSHLAPTPMAATRIDGSFGQSVAGLGAYIMWNNWIYVEATVYRGLGRDIRNATGILPVAGSDNIVDNVPYWRLAVQHDYGRSNWEIGTYGIYANVLPGGASPGGNADHFLDLAADANWQFSFNPRRVTGDVISAHATFIHEDQNLVASTLAGNSLPQGYLTTARADVSYSIGATVTPSVQIFTTNGSVNPSYWATPNGKPDSTGAIAEIAYVPWGKPDSFIKWGNLRLALQYVVYTRFDGATLHASDNDTLYLSVWAAWHF
jgi:hypothetical protein